MFKIKKLDKLIEIGRREQFQPSFLGILISPVFIIRYGLYKHIREIASKVDGDILDFGCGSKPYENLFTGAKSYIGVDVVESGHDHSDSKIDFYFDGDRLPFPDDTFDSVVAFEVFEHVFNLTQVLKEINRVSSSSGTLLFSIPFAYGEHEIPFDYARYTSFGIKKLLSDAGYEVLEYRKTTSHFLAIAQLLILYIVQSMVPTKKRYYYIIQILFIFPITLASLVLDFVLPKNYDLYCSSVVLCRKNGISSVS